MKSSFVNSLLDQIRLAFPGIWLSVEWLAVTHHWHPLLPWLHQVMFSYPVLFYPFYGFSHVHISQNSVLFPNLFSFHTLSLGSSIYTYSLISKLNTVDFAQWFILHIMQASAISMSKPESTFPKLVLSVFFITADGTTSILSLKLETKDYMLTLTLSHLTSNHLLNSITKYTF